MVQDPYWLTATIRGMILYHIYLTQLLQPLSEDTNNIAGEAEGRQKSQSSPCITWPDSFQSLLYAILPCCHSASSQWRLSSPSFPVLLFLLSVSLAVARFSAVPVVLAEAPLPWPSRLLCISHPILHYYHSIFSHFHPVKLPHWLSPNEYSSSSLDLLNAPNKSASNPHPYLLLRWCFVSSAQAPSHRKHCTRFCFSYPHTFKISMFSCKALPKAVTCTFLCADVPEPPWIWNSARFTWVFFFSQFIQHTSQGIQRRAVYPDTKRDFKVLREHEIISLIPCFITDCKAAHSCYLYRNYML